VIYIVLPSFNEEQGLQSVLPGLEKLSKERPGELFRVVVVDDGSQDRTSEVANSFSNRLDIKIFRFEQNRGVGEVFKQGLHYVRNDSKNPSEDICVVLDSDNTQDPRVMLEMMDRIRQGDDIVIASRFQGHGKMVGCPWTRKIFSYGVSWLLQLIISVPNVKDYSIFYRAYRISILQEGFLRYGDQLLEGQGFSSIAGLLIKLGNITRKISEVPFVLRYDLKTGSSGMKVIKTIQGYLGLIYRYLSSNRFRNLERSTATPSVKG